MFLVFKNNKKDDLEVFQINITIMERVIDDYVELVLKNEIASIKSNHDLNTQSPTNSIKLFNTKKNELVAQTTIKIINLLSRENRKYLLRKFTDQTLGLMITSRILQHIS